MTNKKHQTILLDQDENSETWQCPQCGMIYQLISIPTFHRKLIAPGDSSATHYGSHGPLDLTMTINLADK